MRHVLPLLCSAAVCNTLHALLVLCVAHAMQKEVCAQLKAASTTGQRVAISRDESTHAVDSGVWGFQDSEAGFGSSTHAVGLDSMHNDDLGVFEYIIEAVPKYLAHKYTAEAGSSDGARARADAVVLIMNQRLKLMPRAEDFTLPQCGGAYIPDHTHAQAKEHRNVMQVLPHIFHGLDDDLTEVAARYEPTLPSMTVHLHACGIVWLTVFVLPTVVPQPDVDCTADDVPPLFQVHQVLHGCAQEVLHALLHGA